MQNSCVATEILIYLIDTNTFKGKSFGFIVAQSKRVAEEDRGG